MENFGLKLSKKAAYFIIIITIFVIIIGCLFTITHWKGASEILLLGLIFQIFIWIYFLVDILKSNISNKGFWIPFMLVFVPLTQLVYIYKRNTSK